MLKQRQVSNKVTVSPDSPVYCGDYGAKESVIIFAQVYVLLVSLRGGAVTSDA